MVNQLEFLTDYNKLKERFVSHVLIDSIFDALFTVEQVMECYEKVVDFDV